MIKYLQLPTCKLAEFISSSDTSFTVSGFMYNDGVTPVATTDIGDICFATLEPKTAREELISFTIDSVTAAGVATITATRGLLQKSPYTTGGATFDHQNGSDLVISNNPGLFNQLTAKDNPEVITEQWTFPEPTANNSPATKAYADSLSILGGAEATNTTRGNVMLSESPALTIGTATVSIATPAVVSFVAHGLVEGDSIKLTTTGALPTGLTAGNTYFVMATGLTVNEFQVSATLGGAAIDTSGTQSGTHTLTRWTPVALKGTAKTVQFINAITGMISMYASATPPAGFLLCNGQAVSRTTYADLFSVISTTYGVGDGATTFNVPDLASRFPLGYSATAPTKVFTFASRSSNVITVTGGDNHAQSELQTGQAVVYTSSGSVITGLTSGSTYYLIRTAYNTFSLATSVDLANHGSAITLSSDGSGTQLFTVTYSARPIAQKGGTETDTTVPSHHHNLPVNGYLATGAGESGWSSASSRAFYNYTFPIGSNTPNNMPLFTVVNYIIKT
jgi:microcystin-dependent protein